MLSRPAGTRPQVRGAGPCLLAWVVPRRLTLQPRPSSLSSAPQRPHPRHVSRDCGGVSSCPAKTDSFDFRPALEANVFGLEMSHLEVSLSRGCLPWSREHVYGGLRPPGRLQVRAGLCSMCSGPHPILRLSSGDTGRIQQLAKPRPREAKWLPQSAGARIPTWAVQIQAQFLLPMGPRRRILSGFSVAGWTRNEPKEPQTPSRALRPPPGSRWDLSCAGLQAALAQAPHLPCPRKMPRSCHYSPRAQCRHVLQIQGHPRPPDPARMSKGLEAKLAGQ